MLNIDTKSAFTETDKQFRQINMILKHLLPADDRHTVISGRTHIEVIPDSLLTLKIPCFGKTNPCKVFFRYLGLNNEQLDPKM